MPSCQAASQNARSVKCKIYIEKYLIPEIKGSFYVITVMDAFSRAVLSSGIFQGQDLARVLIILYASVERNKEMRAVLSFLRPAS